MGVAYIAPKPGQQPTPEELKAWCKRAIADYKIPKGFVINRNLPLLPNNKIDKVALQVAIAD